jgi:hypothetical protein
MNVKPRKPLALPSAEKNITELGEGTFGRERDVSDWSYYDTLTIDPTNSEYTLFNQNAGRSLAETNYNGNGLFPQAQQLRIKAFKVFYRANGTKNSNDITSLYQLLEQSTITLQIQNKAPSYQKTLMETFGISMGFHATPTVAGDTELIMSLNRFVGIDPLNRAIVIAALTPFTVNIKFYGPIAAGLTGDKIKIALSGLLKRST